jgi:hypothetical protein
MKVSKSEQIRRLIAKGLDAATIAKRLKVETNYVHQVKWHDKQRKLGDRKVAKKAAKTNGTNGHAVAQTLAGPVAADATLEYVDSQRMSFLLGSAVTAISEGTDASLQRAVNLLNRELHARAANA